MDIIDELQAEFAGLDHQTDNYFRVSSGKLKYKEGSVVNLIPHYELVALESISFALILIPEKFIPFFRNF